VETAASTVGKKITGRKRHILVDTMGLLLRVVVQPADLQDPPTPKAAVRPHAAAACPGDLSSTGQDLGGPWL